MQFGSTLQKPHLVQSATFARVLLQAKEATPVTLQLIWEENINLMFCPILLLLLFKVPLVSSNNQYLCIGCLQNLEKRIPWFSRPNFRKTTDLFQANKNLYHIYFWNRILHDLSTMVRSKIILCEDFFFIGLNKIHGFSRPFLHYLIFPDLSEPEISKQNSKLF